MISHKILLRYILVSLLSPPFIGQAQTQTTNYTTSGTWTCPTGVTSITIQCWGGGGAGASVGGNPAAGGGGAGGAYARKTLTVVPGTVYNFTVGAQKSSGAKSVSASSNNGNPTWFGSTSTVYAAGGAGAAGGADTNNFNGTGALGTTTGSIGDVVYAGGNGTNGASTADTAGGAGGGAAGTSANGGNATAGTGGSGGGGNPGTGAGANGPANSTAGTSGANYGGGGAGGKANTTTDRAGGAGAAGYLRITYQNNTPINVTATAASATQINLSWTDNSSNETGFEIWMSSSAGGTYTLFSTTVASATTYSHNGLAANTAYYYKVKAVNSANATINSAFSSVATTTTLILPATPGSPAATSQGNSSIVLNWIDMATNETGYQISRSTTQGGTYNLIYTTSANATSYIDKTGLNANTTYYYVLRAVNTTDNSGYSTEVSARTYDAVEQAMSDWSFQYKYDARKRMIAKKVPGADWVYMVYDNRDRLVLTQDGNQRRDTNGAYKNQWTFTKYDQLNRPIMTGIYTHDSYKTQTEMSVLISTTNFFDTYDGSGTFHGYTNTVFPQNNLDVLTVSYYDNYSFKTLWGGTVYDYVNEGLNATVINGSYTAPTTENTRVLGQVTGSKTKVLDAAGSNYIKAVTYYDDKYRPIQVISDAYLNGAIPGTDRTTSLYDFPGKVLKTLTKHNIVSGTPAKTITRRMEYDHAGRLLKTFHQVDAQTEVLLAMNVYNELGQLVDKKLHSTDAPNTPDASRTFKQSVDMRYNIRGWLTSINNSQLAMDNGATNDDSNDLFGMSLLYEQSDANLGSTGQFNGNISAMKWSANLGQTTEKERGYAFSYDALNRLLAANHKTKTATWAASGSYHENGFVYDLNGNIKNLDRKGANASNMDELTYTYAGNQLLTVADAGDKTKGFIEPTSTTGNDYSYDVNGNMTVDQNKGITSIAYNHLNLPRQVTKNTGENIKYIYDATGRKLRQEVYNASSVLQKSTDYAGEFIYEGTTGNTSLQLINHEEGRIIPTDNEYQYHLKDHLGNVRLTFTTKQEVESATATMETANASTEQGQFIFYDEAVKINSPLFDHTNAGGSNYSIRLNGSANERVGLSKSLSVMPGDTVNIEVYAKYLDTDENNWTQALADLMAAIIGGTAPPGTFIDGGSTGSTGGATAPYLSVLNKSGETGTAPKAYLNFITFDRDYNPVMGDVSQTDFKRISTAAKESGADVAHEKISTQIIVKQAGYMYIYLSNDNDTPVDVYFDDFTVEHIKSPVVQQEDYYPFGLTFNSYSRENSVEQRHKFNSGSELISDLGLNWYSTARRNYEPSLGRFWGIDAMADLFPSVTPMIFGYNNPIMFNDPLGLFGEGGDTKDGKNYDVDGGYIGAVTVTAARQNADGTQDFTWLYNYIGRSNSPISRFVRSKGEDAYRFWHTNRTMHWGKQPEKSKWMKDFNKVFGTALNVGVTGTIVASVALPAVAEMIAENMVVSVEEAVRGMALEGASQILSGTKATELDVLDMAISSGFGFNTFGSILLQSNFNFSSANGFQNMIGTKESVADMATGAVAAGANQYVGMVQNVLTQATLKLGIDWNLKIISNQLKKTTASNDEEH